MRQHPQYRPLRVNILSLLSKELGDLRGRTTLAHELIQNADDAKNDAGRLCATQATFDITDDALIVSNDAVFRQIDFDRITEVASGSKREESGERTTGKFGIGFISVYQVTDRPEIRSAGQVYRFRPDKPSETFIEYTSDPSITRDKGTVFYLPWAFEESEARNKLRVQPITDNYIESFVEELKSSLPRALLFLKNLRQLELRQNGEPVSTVSRVVTKDTIEIDQDGDVSEWRVFKGEFSSEAEELKYEYGSLDQQGSDHIRVAVPVSPIDTGLLFTTLPTTQATGLPFHVDADFYPASDRKSIYFDDDNDPASEWNRAAIRAAASVVSSHLIPLRDMYEKDAPAFWDFLSSIQKVYQSYKDDSSLPLGVFWTTLLPRLRTVSIVYTASGKWCSPDSTRIPTGRQEELAAQAFEELGITIVHQSLWTHRNMLTHLGVSRINVDDISNCFEVRGYTDKQPMTLPPVAHDSLSQLWHGIEGVLRNLSTDRAREAAERKIRRCSLALGSDGAFWPCSSTYQADSETRDLFAPLISADNTFLVQEGVPLLERLCPTFTAENALRTLARKTSEQLTEDWEGGRYDPRTILRWFKEHKTELSRELLNSLARLSLTPGIDGRLWPCRSTYRAGSDTRELFRDLMHGNETFLAEVGLPMGRKLCPQFDIPKAIRVLQPVSPQVLAERLRSNGADVVRLLDWFASQESRMSDNSKESLSRLQIFPSGGGLRRLRDLWLPGGFDDPLELARVIDTAAMSPRVRLFLEELGARQLTFDNYVKNEVPRRFTDNRTNAATIIALLELLEIHIGQIRGDSQCQSVLSRTRIVECTDGSFRQPASTYFQSDDLVSVLGHNVSYAHVCSEPRRDLYSWLGVRSTPCVNDLLKVLERTIVLEATTEARNSVVTILDILAQRWSDLNGSDRERYEHLKAKEWLPCKEETGWFSPDELCLTKYRLLFASQAKFLDVPVQIQDTSAEFLVWLGVRAEPRTCEVVRHLIWCSERNEAPSTRIYEWLSRSPLAPKDILTLKASACLWVGDTYVRPREAFLGGHQFGRFRVQLDTESKKYQNLLDKLGVREEPNHRDAIQVLKDIDKRNEGHVLEQDDLRVVTHCWRMLSNAIDVSELIRDNLKLQLAGVRCIPNKDGVIHKPSRIFFEDRPDLAEKFDNYIGPHLITPPEKSVWIAMEAAGVRRVSEFVVGSVSESPNNRDDHEITKRIEARYELIRTILNAGQSTAYQGDDLSLLRRIRAVSTDKINVQWRLDAFGLGQESKATTVAAYYDSTKQVILYTRNSFDSPSWSAISRELALALGFGETLASVSPGLKTVLEARTYRIAHQELVNLGIAPLEVRDDSPVEQPLAKSLGDDSVGTDPLNAESDTHAGLDTSMPGDGHDTSSVYGHDARPISSPPGSRGYSIGDTGGSGRRQANYGRAEEPIRGIVSADVEAVPSAQEGDTEPFARLLFGTELTKAAEPADRSLVLPSGGPQTPAAAIEHTVYSGQVGRSGSEKPKVVTRWEPTAVSKALSDEFKTMMHADYGKRCQICGTTFEMYSGELHTYVVHLVKPSADDRTNHLGNMMSLCGQHFALVQYAERKWVYPNPDDTLVSARGQEAWENWRDFVLSAMGTAAEKVDAEGNAYIGLPIRFWRVYEGWNTEAGHVDEEARYCIPHWQYLCELLKM